MSTWIRAEDLDDLAVGATLLGSGGGGPTEFYLPYLRRVLPPEGVEVLTLAEAAERGIAVVAPVGMVGATSVLTEKLPGGGEVTAAVAALRRWTGRPVEAVAPVEGAGVNAVLPVAAAVGLGVPLVDADLMGRAMPRFDQLSVVAEDRRLLRCAALAQPGGQVLVLDRSDATELERTVRDYVAHAGGWAGAAFGPLAVADLAGRACEGSLRRSQELGRSLRDGAGERLPSGGVLLAAGRVMDVVRASTPRFARTSFAIAHRDGPVLRVEAESEYLVAVRDGEPVVTCPDLICVLDRRTHRSVAVDDLRLGDDVRVVALPGPSWWTASESRLETVGPRAFGIDLDPVLLPRAAA